MLPLLLSTCGFAPVPDDIRKEFAALQGAWVIIGDEQGGSYVDRNTKVGSRALFVIKDDLLIFQAEGSKNPPPSSRIKILRPGVVDLYPNDKPLKGQRLEGIYRIEGDKLWICHTMVEPFEKIKRPTMFKTSTDEWEPYILYALKRTKE